MIRGVRLFDLIGASAGAAKTQKAVLAAAAGETVAAPLLPPRRFDCSAIPAAAPGRIAAAPGHRARLPAKWRRRGPHPCRWRGATAPAVRGGRAARRRRRKGGPRARASARREPFAV